MNPDRSYSFVNLDQPEYTQNVPWNGPIYFQFFYLMFFVLLVVSEFRSYVID